MSTAGFQPWSDKEPAKSKGQSQRPGSVTHGGHGGHETMAKPGLEEEPRSSVRDSLAGEHPAL